VGVGDTVKIRAERDDETESVFGANTDDSLVAAAPTATVPLGQ
jgi:hypothetical protein